MTIGRQPGGVARFAWRRSVTRSLLTAVATASTLLLAGPVPARAAEDAATRLAEMYSPEAVIQPQTRPCGPGEAYRPTVVDLVLGNQEVVLRNAQGRIVKRAPTAQDLADAAASDYIDQPGDPLTPGCTYERDFKRWYGDRSPTVYAHVATDSEHPGRLAVQYWFYYTFNDFTNKHEGDWEMAQLDFAATSPEQALKTSPYEVDLAQHAGGERGAWSHDGKLARNGTHPIAYVATGSHADYFQRRLYLGTGGGAIFGCEDTRSATTHLALRAILLPGAPVPKDSAFAWLDFRGRWGQKEAGINNGPLGPAQSPQWTHPIAWADRLRDDSVTVPGLRALGVSVTSFFCSAVNAAAVAFNWSSLHPTPFLLLVVFALLAALLTVRHVAWRPPDARPLRRRRGGGQILRASRRLYFENPLTFIGIGLIFIPVSAVAAGVQWVLFHLTPIDNFVALDGKLGAGTVFLALLTGDLGAVFAAVAVTAAVSAALAELERGRRVTPVRAYTLAARNTRALTGATLVQYLISVLLVLSVVGIPIAIYRFVRTSLYAQGCVLENESALGSLRASRRLTRGRWWRTLGFSAFVDTLAIVSGPILGIIVLLLISQSLTFIDVTGSIIYAVTVPYAAIALTLYYFDLETRRSVRVESVPRPGAGDGAAVRKPWRETVLRLRRRVGE